MTSKDDGGKPVVVITGKLVWLGRQVRKVLQTDVERCEYENVVVFTGRVEEVVNVN